MMTNTILSTKLRNAINNAAYDETKKDLEYFLKNISINGVKRGCSGFVKNKTNGACVYITTEPYNSRLMYRYADNERDFTGYHNRWADNLNELVRNVLLMLDKTPAETRDKRI